MNRYLLLAVMIFLTLFLSTGCGQLLVAIGGAEAVLLQAEGNLENEKGFSYKGEGKGTISEPSGMSIEIEQEGTYRFVWDPYGVHVEETIKAFGGPLKQEYYITDKEGYEWVEGEGWQKLPLIVTISFINMILELHYVFCMKLENIPRWKKKTECTFCRRIYPVNKRRN